MRARLSYVRVELTQGQFATVSTDDLDLIRQFKWHAVRCSSKWYAARNEQRAGKSVRVYMHRQLLFGGSESDLLVDHINGDGLDNRRENLRAANHSQNGSNRVAGTGKTGFRGVSQHGDKFMVRVADRYVGLFDNLPEAAFRANQALDDLSPGVGQRNVVDWDALIATMKSRRDAAQEELDLVMGAANGR